MFECCEFCRLLAPGHELVPPHEAPPHERARYWWRQRSPLLLQVDQPDQLDQLVQPPQEPLTLVFLCAVLTLLPAQLAPPQDADGLLQLRYCLRQLSPLLLQAVQPDQPPKPDQAALP